MEPPFSDIKPTFARFAAFGIALLLLTLIAVATGLLLLPFYRPTVEGAHASVAAMQASAPLRFLRAAHHWTSALLILLGALYLVYGLVVAAYRRPWRFAWMALVGLVLLYWLFQVTGHLLPWDRHAVSTAAIEIGIAASAPVVGPLQARILRGGGEALSERTLTAWYVAHVVLLPLALAALAGLLYAQIRRLAGRPRLPQIALAAAIGLLLVMSLGAPAPLGPAAEPEDYASFTAPPEWYVLPLHGLMSLVQRIHPNLSFVGSMLIPGLVLLGLLLLPWLDRREARERPSRLIQSATAVGLAALLFLFVTNADHMSPLLSAPEHSERVAVASTPRNDDPPLDPELVKKGQALVQSTGCLGCHAIGGQGGAVGPALDGTGSRHPDIEWQIRHLKNPPAEVPGSTMPPYNHLSEPDLRAMAHYLVSLK